MTKVTANTLQEALSKAALELGCSVTELDYEVVQYESKGVLGIGKKDAIIIANLKNSSAKPDNTQKHQEASYQQSQTSQSNQTIQESSQANSSQNNPNQNNQGFFDASEFVASASLESSEPNYESGKQSHTNQAYANYDELCNTDNTNTTQTKKFQTKEEVASEIQNLIQEMLSYTPYKIDNVNVGFYDNQTLSIYIDGEDSALLIGERGYRYKAISYLLFNWIQPAYGYNIRLEIAQFLQNQEEAIDAYLVGIINEVKREGRAQTKPLDGILAFIALKKLRGHFPDKYISFRENPQNEKYIIINDFYR